MPRRDVVARARHRHGCRRPRDPGREPEVRRPRAAAGRPRRPRSRRRLEGPHLPQVPRRPARVGRRREGDARGRDRGDADPPQPARCARAADRRDLRRRRDLGRRPARARARRLSLRRSPRGPAGERARHARRPLSVRRVRRVAPADRLGPHGRCRQGTRGRAPARRHERGHDPDRGLFGVFQVDGGGRVGELDEEMVYEARQGQTFMLGASTWRIEEITRDRVLVSPAPGAPGAVPFWKGEGSAARSSWARRSAGRRERSLRSRTRRRSSGWAATTTSTRSRPRTSSRTSATRRRRTAASSPPTARSSSSASVTRSATGGCAS